MIPVTEKCEKCGASFEVATYRKFTVCPFCSNKKDFPGFEYEDIDWNVSMYAGIKRWMDCPSCRSKNMYLISSGKMWKCPDCGYSVSNKDKRHNVFWFCDECEAYLNVQPGFTTKDGKWKCTECGFTSDVTKNNII